MKPDIVDKLFAEYYNEALLYTTAICRNETVAEDIVSTAFYKALQAANEEVKNFKPWLFAVCRNEFFSLCRKNKVMSYEELPEETADGTADMAERLILKEEYRALYRAIRLLNEAQREAITMFYFSALSVKDIAEVTGKSEANVKVLLYRGRERLKELMEENR